MKKITKCKECNKEFEVIKGWRICKNLVCVEYNKKFGKKTNTVVFQGKTVELEEE